MTGARGWRLFSAHSVQSGESHRVGGKSHVTGFGLLLNGNMFFSDDCMDDFFSPFDLSLPFSGIVGSVIL